MNLQRYSDRLYSISLHMENFTNEAVEILNALLQSENEQVRSEAQHHLNRDPSRTLHAIRGMIEVLDENTAA